MCLEYLGNCKEHEIDWAYISFAIDKIYARIEVYQGIYSF